MQSLIDNMVRVTIFTVDPDPETGEWLGEVEKTDAGLSWYCPHGHECYTSKFEEIGTPECGSCGATMSTDSEAFCDVLGEIESEGIARVESNKV